MSAPNNNQQSATNEDILERIDALQKDINIMKKAIVLQGDIMQAFNMNIKLLHEMINNAMKVMSRGANIKA